MADSPTEVQLELVPQCRFDVINVTQSLQEDSGDFLNGYRRALYCSYHTTAGYLDQAICTRLNNSPDSLLAYVKAFRSLFPPNGPYEHDKMHLRSELSEEQRLCEPRNADSHLTFIGSGLNNCATYLNRSDAPVYLIDLDGVYHGTSRRRKTSIIGFNEEEIVEKVRFSVSVSGHPVDSINLRDERHGLFELLAEVVNRQGIGKGRIDISLAPEEQHAALTVNEYETLLMKHDLAEVLRNPLRFMAEKGRNMLGDPWAIPNKTISYARYDLVHVINELVEAFGVSDSALERLIDRFLTVTASRFLRVKRAVRIPVCDSSDADGIGSIIQGTYQSPILVQWDKSVEGRRELEIAFSRFV